MNRHKQHKHSILQKSCSAGTLSTLSITRSKLLLWNGMSRMSATSHLCTLRSFPHISCPGVQHVKLRCNVSALNSHLGRWLVSHRTNVTVLYLSHGL
jgi:hypothetical protein